MRLIDADRLDYTVPEDPHYLTSILVQVLKKAIDKCPTVDAVPVVRCKECKWFADNNDGEWYGCQMFETVLNNPEDAPKPDDFCSYGERKENNHEKD